MSQLGAIKIYRHFSKVTIYAFFLMVFEIIPAKLAALGRQLRFSEIRSFFFEEKAAKLRHIENSLERSNT